ncbi:endonuclease domain-containing protein [Rhodopseudomonas parapalustris]
MKPWLQSRPSASISVEALGNRIVRLRPGERLTVVGIGINEIRRSLTTIQAERSALVLPEAGSTDAILSHLVDDLADLALACWPRWYGMDCSRTDGTEIATADRPTIAAAWFRAASRRAAHGHRPRLRRAARSIEFKQLMQAIDPPDLLLLAAIDPLDAVRAAPVIQVLEWCASHGASVVAIFPSKPLALAPFDRLLYGALEVVSAVEPLQTRFIAPSGRAHHLSLIEQRVEAALLRDGELASLFMCNQSVAIDGYGTPRVDLLWRDGRVVVELDGPEHQSDPNFANDRHRDYELLVAGYLVLRITNQQVATDLQAAIEKIRAVVRYRKSTLNSRYSV